MQDADRRVDLGFAPDRYAEGIHLCCLFSDEPERASVVHPFVYAGLRDGEDVEYLAEGSPDDVRARALDPRSEGSLSPDQLGRLSIKSALDTYCPSGVFIPEVMLDHLRYIHEQARADGSTGGRVVGETDWVTNAIPGTERFVEYESAINKLTAETPLAILCEYDTGTFDGGTLLEILNVHPMMVVQGQIMRNPYYLPPDVIDLTDGPRSGGPATAQQNVLGRLLVVQQTLASLPDEVHIAQFTRAAFLQVPGVGDVHACFRSGTVPPDVRLEEVRKRCEAAWSDPASLDLGAIERETGARCLAVRTPSHLFGAFIVEVADTGIFAPYEDFIANIANAVALALDQRLSRAQLRLWRDRIVSLERHLWRIATELEGSGVIAGLERVPDPSVHPGIGELSARQWEVLTRLLRGERVPSIAKELFVSQSTVRNHLTEIYRKLGVHSQHELLELLRADQRG
jgi:DNA-binding CsgD family transcriptional regulator